MQVRSRKISMALAGIMVAVATIILVSALAVLYQTAFEQFDDNLSRTATSQARLLEAVAKFDRSYSDDFPEGSVAATLSQIEQAFQSIERIGETGEFLLAGKQGQNIEFLLISPGKEGDVPDLVPYSSDFAEPMRQALSGDSGTMIGRDYAGTYVLAAYQPVAVLDLGIVVKIDLAEIRAPFIKAGAMLVIFSLLLTTLGSFLFFRISSPLVRRMDESEQRYARATVGTNDGLWDWNIQTGENYFSPRWAELLGYGPDELDSAAGSFVKLIHPDDRDRARTALQTHLEQKTPYDCKLRLRQKNGEYLWVQSRGRAIWDADGQALYMAGSITDITARRKSEEELRQYEHIVSNATDMMALLDLNFVYLAANEAYLAAFGKKQGEIIGKPCAEVFGEEFFRATIATHAELCLSGQDVRYQDWFEFPTAGRRYMDVAYSPYLGPDEEVRGFVVNARDITEHHQAEAALRDSEEKFRTVFDTIETGTIVIDTKGVIQIFNPAAEAMFGYKSGEIVGKNVSILMPEPDHSKHDGYLKNYADTGKAKVICIGRKVEGIRKGGEVFPLQLEVGEMKINDDVCFVGSVADLTKLQSLENQLHQAQKLEAVGQLTGGIAHDFNNLLSVIQGNLSLVAADIDAGTHDFTDDPAELVQDALDAGERGAELTHRLLAFSRKQALSPKSLRLNDLITGMEGLLRRTLGETIDLDVVIQKDIWEVLIDPPQLENSLLNLVINARDAMAQGGRLTIETKNATLGDSFVSSHLGSSAGEHVMLAVSDSGIGMTPAILGNIFDPFFTTKKVGQGSGLGLSMIHGFVNQSGGFIDVSSEPGKGTSIKLYFPRSTMPKEIVSPVLAATPVGGDEKILVVEDDEDVRRMTVRILSRLGYRVFEAEDGKTAMEILDQDGPLDLLLSDVVLRGGITGPDVIRAARKKDSNLKVLYMSGYTDHAVLKHGRLDPSIELIKKPFSHLDLGAKVRDMLESTSQVSAR